MDNLHLVKLEEIPDLLRWVELQRRAGHLSEEQAGEGFVKIGAWRLWLELNQDGRHWTAREQFEVVWPELQMGEAIFCEWPQVLQPRDTGARIIVGGPQGE